jgi:hypothetical protein
MLTGILSNSRNQKEDLRVETGFEALRRHPSWVITVKLPQARSSHGKS